MKCEYCNSEAIGHLCLLEIRAQFPFCSEHLDLAKTNFDAWLKRTHENPTAKICNNCGAKYPITAWACYHCSVVLDEVA